MKGDSMDRPDHWDAYVAGELISGRVLKVSPNGTETTVECPKCHKPKLQVSTTGLYHCWVCAISGRILVRHDLGHTPARPASVRHYVPMERHDELLVGEFEHWTRFRGLTPDVVRYAELYPTEISDRPFAVLPWNSHMGSDRTYWTARAIDDGEPRYLFPPGGYPNVLPSLYLHDGGAVPRFWESPVVYVVEGPLDVLRWLSWVEEHPAEAAGLHATHVIGLGGVARLNPEAAEWFRLWEQNDTLFVWALDSDDVGKEASNEYRKRYGGVAVDVIGRGKDPGAWTLDQWSSCFKQVRAAVEEHGLLAVPARADNVESLRVGPGAYFPVRDADRRSARAGRREAGATVRGTGGQAA
jgi:hypothetical protein